MAHKIPWPQGCSGNGERRAAMDGNVRKKRINISRINVVHLQSRDFGKYTFPVSFGNCRLDGGKGKHTDI